MSCSSEELISTPLSGPSSGPRGTIEPPPPPPPLTSGTAVGKLWKTGTCPCCCADSTGRDTMRVTLGTGCSRCSWGIDSSRLSCAGRSGSGKIRFSGPPRCHGWGSGLSCLSFFPGTVDDISGLCWQNQRGEVSTNQAGSREGSKPAVRTLAGQQISACVLAFTSPLRRV